MPQESQTSSGHNPDSQVPIMDELEKVYQKQEEHSIPIQFDPETVANPETRKLFKIADDITKARTYQIETQSLTHAEHQKKFTKSVTKVILHKALPRRRETPVTEGSLKAKESEIGAKIFGLFAPSETRREFFYDRRVGDRDSWFFHQEIADSTGTKQVTLHYEVHPSDVLRVSSHPGTQNEFIQGQELHNFSSAAEIYHDQVMEQIYNPDAISSKKVA